MFVINYALLVEGAIVMGPITLFSLKQLGHTKFVAQSQAWTNIVNGAAEAVSEIEKQLQGLPAGDASESGLVDLAISDLRTVYVASIARLGGNTVFTDAVLKAIMQRVKLPGGAQTLVNDFLGTAPSVSGASRVGAVLRKPPMTFGVLPQML